jgi:uncharacterized protein YdeI (YjbR/CyaY-like superfamily)
VSTGRTELPLLEVANRAELRAWLAENSMTSPGVRLAIGKKGNTVTELSYDDAVEEGLCFGWIDSVAGRLDEARFTTRFTPRKPGGTWARTNKVRIERLIAEGLMTPAGMAVIEAAKADGSWTLLDDVEDLIVPDDLAAALAENPAANQYWRTQAGASVRKIALHRIASAKRPETRAKRIAETVAEAARGEMRYSP